MQIAEPTAERAARNGEESDAGARSRKMDRKPGKSALARLADFIDARQRILTEQWTIAIRRDTDMSTSDGMTHQQLVDHLPQLFSELTEFLRRRDAAILHHEVKEGAREHGKHRGRHGYRSDELLREIETLRRLLLAMVVTTFAESEPDFRGAVEANAHNLISEFFSAVTVDSVKQYMLEQQNRINDYTARLEEGNHALTIANGKLE